MPAMTAWSCTSCGGENPEGMRFCGHCGAPAGAVAPPPPVPAGEPPADPEDEREAALTAFASDRIDPSGAGMSEERRLITALFADLSGFTPLSERLDAEELLEVIDPIISALSDLVGRYGGYVEKFAGDALLALFGAPVAHEDDASRAIQVALDMHAELDRLRGSLGPNGDGLSLHIGIASGRGIARMIGSSVRMDYAVLGDSVILAQRLESNTPSGQTYVSESTYALAQDRFVFEPVPPLTLKGKAEPVPAWRLLGTRAAGEGRSALAGRRQTPLVGRESELARVEAALDAVAERRGGVQLVVGEPGVGKSRLTDAIRERASERGIAWLEARCISYGAGLVYWPYLDLLRRELGIGPDDDPTAAAESIDAAMTDFGITGAAPFLRRVLGFEAAELAELDPEDFRRGLHEAVGTWLGARAGAAPLVLAVEDAHWADASSRELTADLVARMAETRVGIFVTSRPPAPDWLAPGEGIAAIELGALGEDAVGRLVEHVLEGPGPSGLVRMIVERAAGNPFFAQEIVRSLQDAAVLARGADGRWRLSADWSAEDVPATIEGVLAARIDALPSSGQSTLSTASVIGRRVPVALLEGVIGDGPRVRSDLGELLGAGLLDPAEDDNRETVIFHHALIAEVAYGRLLRRRRRELHLRTAQVAEALYGSGDDSIELLARHLYLGDAGEAAIEYLVRAATRAAGLYANDEAIVHLRRAEELAAKAAEPGDRLRDIRLRLGDLQEVVGAYEDAEGTYRRVLDDGVDVRGWRGLVATHRVRGAYREALRLLEEAFALPDLGDADLRPLWLERGLTLVSAEAMNDAVDAFGRGIDERAAATDDVAGALLIELARAEYFSGNYAVAHEHANRALAIAGDADDARAETKVLRVLGSIQQSLGDLGAAAGSLRRALEIAQRIGSVEAIGAALINLGLVERDRGNLDDAIQSDREAIAAFERIGHGAGRTIGYANLADKLRRRGDLAEAHDFASRAHDLAEQIGHAMSRADSVQILGEISYARGAFEEAAELAERSADLFLAADARPGAAEAYELAERAWRALGDEERAAASAARMAAMSEGTG